MTKNKQDHYFPSYLFQFRVMDGQSLSPQLRVPGRHPPWAGPPSITGTHAHSPRLGPVRHITAHLWDVEGYRSSPSKPTQTRGKRANHTDSGPGRNPFSFPPNQHNNKTLLEEILQISKTNENMCIFWKSPPKDSDTLGLTQS